MAVESCKNCKSLFPHNVVLLYCPNCGINIANPDNISSKESKYRKVSRKQQILFTFLPLMLFVASFRIFKFKKTILLSSILSIGSIFYLYSLYYYLVPILYPSINSWPGYPPITQIIFLSLIYWIIPSVIIMLFVASFRIFKFKKKILLLSILSIGSIFYLAFLVELSSWSIDILLVGFPPIIPIIFLSFSLWIIPSVVMTYFILKWSKLWNTRITFIETLK